MLSVRRHAVQQPLHENYRFIPLTKGQVAIVDAADYDWLSQFNWFVEDGYAYRYHNYTVVSMSNMILNRKPGEMVDHKNRNRLDNRRANLRRCTHSQNCANRLRRDTRGYRGVRHRNVKHNRRYEAEVIVKGHCIRLGRFASLTDAAAAYDKAARKYFGDFAQTNCMSVLQACEVFLGKPKNGRETLNG